MSLARRTAAAQPSTICFRPIPPEPDSPDDTESTSGMSTWMACASQQRRTADSNPPSPVWTWMQRTNVALASSATRISRSSESSGVSELFTFGQGIPNLDLRVLTLSFWTAPAPTNGLIRTPMTDLDSGTWHRSFATRCSSCRLSMLRCTPAYDAKATTRGKGSAARDSDQKESWASGYLERVAQFRDGLAGRQSTRERVDDLSDGGALQAMALADHPPQQVSQRVGLHRGRMVPMRRESLPQSRQASVKGVQVVEDAKGEVLQGDLRPDEASLDRRLQGLSVTPYKATASALSPLHYTRAVRSASEETNGPKSPLKSDGKARRCHTIAEERQRWWTRTRTPSDMLAPMALRSDTEAFAPERSDKRSVWRARERDPQFEAARAGKLVSEREIAEDWDNKAASVCFSQPCQRSRSRVMR
eukprot:scaffold7417_cov258-Pinguiococcus_pyrenoidosus.AAC.4